MDVYRDYLKNFFEIGNEKAIAENLGISRQAIQHRIQVIVDQTEKEYKRCREDILIKSKYKYIEPKTPEQRYILAQAMIWDGFTYRRIEAETGISASTISKLIAKYVEGEENKTIRKKARKLFNS
jgi:DNA invertase Pin-like site-specific DNA recombinase